MVVPAVLLSGYLYGLNRAYGSVHLGGNRQDDHWSNH